LRFICHCTICQKFNDASYGDAAVYSAASVKYPDSGLIEFKTYKAPPNVQRGSCISCGSPIVELINSPLFPKLTMVPSEMHKLGSDLPTPVAHLFYEHRVADVNDEIRKHTGYFFSQLAFLKHLLVSKCAK